MANITTTKALSTNNRNETRVKRHHSAPSDALLWAPRCCARAGVIAARSSASFFQAERFAGSRRELGDQAEGGLGSRPAALITFSLS